MNHATTLAQAILAKGHPGREQTFPPLAMSVVLQMPIKRDFDQLVDETLNRVCSHKSETYRKPNRDLIRLILTNLIHAAFRFEHLSLPTKVRTGSYLHRLGFSQDRMERIGDVLLTDGWMTQTRGGFRHWGNPKKSRPAQYFPTEKLLNAYGDLLYAEQGDFNQYEPYEYPDTSDWRDPNEAFNTEVLKRYNDMMSTHSWAMKAPTVRKIDIEPFTGGRVYTHYQNIVNRRIPIRSQTLLDGKSIVECDFTSNHPYLIAKLNGHDFDRDAYQVIADKTKVNRKQVKRIITQTIGSTSPQDLNSIKYNLYEIGSANIDRVIEVAQAEMPWLSDSMFCDQGVKLQWLEGEIAIKMFNDAVEMNIPMICIHDAYAVNKQHVPTVTELMHHHREQVIKDSQQRWQQDATTRHGDPTTALG